MLVTTVIPTIGRETLWTRALPSVMAQRAEWCVIVVGDGEVIKPKRGFTSKRFRYLSIDRPDYPKDPAERWRVAGVAAFDHGLDHVETEWWSYLADDDEYTPKHHGELLRWAGQADCSIGAWRSIAHHRTHHPANPPTDKMVLQGAYIIRTVLNHRPRTTGYDDAWDADWWRRLRTEHPDVRYHVSLEVVANYHRDQALEGAQVK